MSRLVGKLAIETDLLNNWVNV